MTRYLAAATWAAASIFLALIAGLNGWLAFCLVAAAILTTAFLLDRATPPRLDDLEERGSRNVSGADL